MIKFDNNGLIPAIVQHVRSGEVLMLGYMNEASLAQTRANGLVTFWSRSRGELWQKGATSGNVLKLVEIRQDCDGDALLVLAEPAGPTCHTGSHTCFFQNADDEAAAEVQPSIAVLSQVSDLIERRKQEQTEGSYTVKLLNGGPERIGKKVGEEATEVVIGAMKGDADELVYETADLFYHTLVLLASQGVAPERVWAELARRYNK
jgi:phosphoribosyl-ATP pyrophosphohydrolase/phosphoribosyl-AMP cyclohydrolase